MNYVKMGCAASIKPQRIIAGALWDHPYCSREEEGLGIARIQRLLYDHTNAFRLKRTHRLLQEQAECQIGVYCHSG